jgi:glycosyltransferase involved in cell wall biosynthesis
MRILWVSPYLPWPTTSGGKTRQYALLRRLADAGHRISLLALAKTAPSTAELGHLEGFLERVIYVRRRPLRHPLTLLHALRPFEPLLASINGHHAAFQHRFRALLTAPWDVIQIEHSYIFQSVERPLRELRRGFVLTEHNVESELSGITLARLGWLGALPAPIERLRYRRWERRVFDLATHLIAVTDADAAAFRTVTDTPVAVVPNGVDTAVFADVAPDSNGQRILFLGNYDYPPNVDAVEWLIADIMPRVWQQQPSARLAVYGHAVPARWRRRHTDPRIEWGGFVDALPTLHRRAAVFVAPLRAGGGSKLKVFEAMASALPIVATPQALTGLGADARHCFAVAEDAAEIATQLTLLLRDPDLARRLGEDARRWVTAHQDWAQAAQALERVYSRHAGGTQPAT